MEADPIYELIDIMESWPLQLLVAGVDGRRETFDLDESVQILVDGEEVTTAALRPGQSLSLSFAGPRPSPVSRILVGDPQ